MLSDLKESLSDGAEIFLSPLHFSARAAAITGITALSTSALVLWADQPVRDYFQRNHTSTGDKIGTFGNLYGTGLYGGLGAVALYSVGLAADQPNIRLMGRHIVQSLAYAGIVTTTLKALFGRERPYLNNGPHVFHGPTFQNAWSALPSGHVTVATAICASVAEDIGNIWASIAIYSVAGSTVYARMYSDQHWSSDVFLAAVIGTASGYWTVHLHDGDKRNEDRTGFYVIPSPDRLFLEYRF
jgi:membrane-associated phospholipid phosphatase